MRRRCTQYNRPRARQRAQGCSWVCMRATVQLRALAAQPCPALPSDASDRPWSRFRRSIRPPSPDSARVPGLGFTSFKHSIPSFPTETPLLSLLSVVCPLSFSSLLPSSLASTFFSAHRALRSLSPSGFPRSGLTLFSLCILNTAPFTSSEVLEAKEKIHFGFKSTSPATFPHTPTNAPRLLHPPPLHLAPSRPPPYEHSAIIYRLGYSQSFSEP